MGGPTRLLVLCALGLTAIGGTSAWADEPTRERDCEQAPVTIPPRVTIAEQDEAARIALADPAVRALIDDAATQRGASPASHGLFISDRGTDRPFLGRSVDLTFTRATPVPIGKHGFRYLEIDSPGCPEDRPRAAWTVDFRNPTTKPIRRIVVEVSTRHGRVISLTPETLEPGGDPVERRVPLEVFPE